MVPVERCSLAQGHEAPISTETSRSGMRDVTGRLVVYLRPSRTRRLSISSNLWSMFDQETCSIENDYSEPEVRSLVAK